MTLAFLQIETMESQSADVGEDEKTRSFFLSKVPPIQGLAVRTSRVLAFSDEKVVWGSPEQKVTVQMPGWPKYWVLSRLCSCTLVVPLVPTFVMPESGERFGEEM